MKLCRLVVMILIVAAAVCAGCLEHPEEDGMSKPAPETTPIVEEHWLSPVRVVACCGEAEMFPASTSIDGNLSTSWGHIKGEAHWIIYDLGSTKEIDKVRIYTDSSYGGAPCKAFIYVSDDKTALLNENKTDYGGIKGSSEKFDAALGWHEIELSNATGRYIKVYPYTHFKPTGTCGWYFSLGGFYEFEYLPVSEENGQF